MPTGGRARHTEALLMSKPASNCSAILWRIWLGNSPVMTSLTRSMRFSRQRLPRFPVSSPSLPIFKRSRSTTRGCSTIARTVRPVCSKALRHPSRTSWRCCHEEESQIENRDGSERAERSRNPDQAGLQSGKGAAHHVVRREYAARRGRGHFWRGGYTRRADRVLAGNTRGALAPCLRRREGRCVMSNVVKFPYNVARSVHSRKPRRSKNGQVLQR